MMQAIFGLFNIGAISEAAADHSFNERTAAAWLAGVAAPCSDQKGAASGPSPEQSCTIS